MRAARVATSLKVGWQQWLACALGPDPVAGNQSELRTMLREWGRHWVSTGHAKPGLGAPRPSCTLRNTAPAVWEGLMPTPSPLMIALVSPDTLNSSAAYCGSEKAYCGSKNAEDGWEGLPTSLMPGAPTLLSPLSPPLPVSKHRTLHAS